MSDDKEQESQSVIDLSGYGKLIRTTKIISDKDEKYNRSVVFQQKGKGNKFFNAYAVVFITREIATIKRKTMTEDILVVFRDSIGLETVQQTLTSLIKHKWKENKVSSQYTRASHLTSFLNWTLINKHYYEKHKKELDIKSEYQYYNSLSDLTINMANEYLELLKYDVEWSYHKLAKTTLQKSYNYLFNNGLLKKVKKLEVDEFFNEGYSSNKNVKPIKHKLPVVLIPVLIQVSEIYTPDITLGVLFGILGGARTGELVNLSKGAVRPLGEFDFRLDIKMRHFRPDVSSPKVKGEVKKQRIQRVYNDKLGIRLFGYNYLQEVYLKHIRQYKPLDGTNALFVENDGKAMTAKYFSDRFAILKRKFIQELKTSKDVVIYSYANTLEM